MDNRIYYREKLMGGDATWYDMGGFGLDGMIYNFEKYDFKINDVIYRDHCNTFYEELGKLQMWESLGGCYGETNA